MSASRKIEGPKRSIANDRKNEKRPRTEAGVIHIGEDMEETFQILSAASRPCNRPKKFLAIF
jgi:hypothetical protein